VLCVTVKWADLCHQCHWCHLAGCSTKSYYWAYMCFHISVRLWDYRETVRLTGGVTAKACECFSFRFLAREFIPYWLMRGWLCLVFIKRGAWHCTTEIITFDKPHLCPNLSKHNNFENLNNKITREENPADSPSYIPLKLRKCPIIRQNKAL